MKCRSIGRFIKNRINKIFLTEKMKITFSDSEREEKNLLSESRVLLYCSEEYADLVKNKLSKMGASVTIYEDVKWVNNKSGDEKSESNSLAIVYGKNNGEEFDAHNKMKTTYFLIQNFVISHQNDKGILSKVVVVVRDGFSEEEKIMLQGIAKKVARLNVIINGVNWIDDSSLNKIGFLLSPYSKHMVGSIM